MTMPAGLAGATGSALKERPGKRRNIERWREARMQRLLWIVRSGTATERQLERLVQLSQPNAERSDGDVKGTK